MIASNVLLYILKWFIIIYKSFLIMLSLNGTKKQQILRELVTKGDVKFFSQKLFLLYIWKWFALGYEWI